MYEEWQAGAAKSVLERKYLGKGESHGKLFTTLVREHLNVDTERRSGLTAERDALRKENARLRALLAVAGVSPDRPLEGP